MNFSHKRRKCQASRIVLSDGSICNAFLEDFSPSSPFQVRTCGMCVSVCACYCAQSRTVVRTNQSAHDVKQCGHQRRDPCSRENIPRMDVATLIAYLSVVRYCRRHFYPVTEACTRVARRSQSGIQVSLAVLGVHWLEDALLRFNYCLTFLDCLRDSASWRSADFEILVEESGRFSGQIWPF